MTGKQALRTEIKQRIKALSIEEKAEFSTQSAFTLINSALWKKADIIFTYISTPDEPDTQLLIEAAFAENKTIAAPRMYGSEMKFHQLLSVEHELERHPYGIREPAASLPVMDPLKTDKNILIIVPGLAFSRSFERLGRGGGYYDRYLEALQNCRNVILAGFCWKEQLLDRLPAEEHDIRLDIIVCGELLLIKA
jgi:5-formyltetrahydrofolate cyclo-ligase